MKNKLPEDLPEVVPPVETTDTCENNGNSVAETQKKERPHFWNNMASREETVKWMEDLPKRKDALIAAIREVKERDLLSEETLAQNSNELEDSNLQRGNGQKRFISVTPEEAYQWMKDFSKRKEEFVAAIRESKDRDISA